MFRYQPEKVASREQIHLVENGLLVPNTVIGEDSKKIVAVTSSQQGLFSGTITIANTLPVCVKLSGYFTKFNFICVPPF